MRVPGLGAPGGWGLENPQARSPQHNDPNYYNGLVYVPPAGNYYSMNQIDPRNFLNSTMMQHYPRSLLDLAINNQGT